MNSNQQRELKKTRETYPKNDRKALNTKIRLMENEKAKANLKHQEAVQALKIKEESAREQLESAVIDLRDAAQNVLTANTTTFGDLFNRYKLLSAKLRQIIDSLPDAERIQHTADMTSIAQRVNLHKEQIDAQDRQARNVIEQTVRKTVQKISRMTVNDLLIGILGTANKQELAELTNLPSMKTITDKTDTGMLVVADLPVTDQTQLVQVMMQALAKSKSDKPGVLGQLIKAMEKDVTALIKGEKTHLSIVYDNGEGSVGSFHIEIGKFINATQTTLDTLFFQLYKQDVDADSGLVMSLTSPTEVGALLQFNEFDMNTVSATQSLEYMTGLVIQNAADPMVLSHIMNKPVRSEEMSYLTSHSTERRAGLKPEEVMGFIGAMAIMLEAGKQLSVPSSSKQHEKPLAQAITGSTMGQIKYVQTNVEPKVSSSQKQHEQILSQALPEQKISADSVCSESTLDPTNDKGKQEINILDGYQDICLKKKKEFEDLIKEFVRINNRLTLQAGKNSYRYGPVSTLASSALNNINRAGSQFFATPNQETFNAFYQAFENSINPLDKELKKHRSNPIFSGLAAVLKGLAGIIAALLVVPALAVQATTKKGYVGTFFSTPETVSSKAFKPVKEGLQSLIEAAEKSVKGPK
ncbi:hypothetical protein [Legionella worsleiensis]|uniref:hypothetical protein n=1 Tax=Legionella worsleiensis TaxID=45076 RepID=UPI0011C0799A|nr:hypothetical protein [Legionella worsleiensis]